MLILEFIFIVIIVFFAIILHECAHGWVAFKLGDPTAKIAGRLTLNPLKHIDPVGTIILPGILILIRLLGYNVFVFGWAKPVPVNFYRLRNPKIDMIWVGLAGPMVNMFIILILNLLIKFSPNHEIYSLIGFAIYVNLLLAAFNLIPVPPLDGSRIVMGILPARLAIYYARLERYGILIVLMLLYFNLLDFILKPMINLLATLLGVHSL